MLATSDSTVYVAEEGMNRVIQIDGVNFAGTPTPIATELAIPSALAVDSTWLYVADANGIQKSDLLTHGQSPLLAMPNVSAITQDDLYVYFLVRGTSADDGGPIAPSTGYVGRIAK